MIPTLFILIRLASILCVVFGWFLNYWNLLGWRF